MECKNDGKTTTTDSTRANSTEVFFRFRSGKENSFEERLSTMHELRKWNLLMTPKESKNFLGKQLEQMQCEIHVEQRKGGSFAFDICSESHEHDFNQWVEECLHLIMESFNDSELLLISAPFDEMQHLSKTIKDSTAVNDGFVSIDESKEVCGQFLLGRGEHVIDLLSDLQRHIKDAKVSNPQNRKDVSYDVFHLNTFQLRLIGMFNGVEKANENHPAVKMYISGDKIMMIGQTDDCSAASDFIRNNSWLSDIQHKKFPAMQEFQFFLKREGVQKYIDSKINSIEGSWAIVELPNSTNTEMVMIYGKTKTDIQSIENILQSSVVRSQCLNMSFMGVKKNREKWQECVKKLEDTFEGKIHMQIEKNSGNYVATVIFTSDLQDDENMRLLLNDIEQQESIKNMVQLNQKQFMWLQKYYLEDIQAEGLKNGIELKFDEEQGGIEITGGSSALTEIKRFINSICMEEQDILLPLNALPSEVCTFLNEKKCCYEQCQVENSKCWINGKTAFCVHKGNKRTEHLFADVKVKPIQSENEDFVSSIKWSDDTNVLLNIPLWQGGDQREEQQVNSTLELLFSDIVKNRKKAIIFELEDLSSWPMENFVKCILHLIAVSELWFL
ncbi:uncharacterized protein LOC133176541 [Saccostrea echinata]|uniref:uncharacterized protein LOC133176541 n=1 Tax=Saccostrea echinata TaxID=191078 RepID=UPI002A7EBD4F|nr:uncharacterized protein LOC133176541 [Saccostrea echinata]